MKAWQGQGSYGAVYRVKRGGFRRSQPGALKVSLLLWNWRMEREVELLSRLNHPSIPRLLDRGGTHPPTGEEHPFFVMEWVEGVPLYAWAEKHSPSGPQLCRVLAQLARALEAVHAEGAVHRDVKGDNVLVRLYPACIDARQDEHGAWQATSPDFRPLLESNPRLEPPLREVILQLLSAAPEQRGTAAQVAQALEAAAGGEERPERSEPPERTRSWKPWLTLAAAAGAVLLWSSQWVSRASEAQIPDADTTAIGDSTSTTPHTASPEENTPLAQEPLPLHRPGQARPDEKGRCLGHNQVPINGGCWVVLLPLSTEKCVESGYVPFQGKCYLPAPAPPKKSVPTSSPGEAH